MKPIYFPYTYISRSTLDNLNFFFKRITVYQPSAPAIPDDLKAFEDEGLIDIQLPVQGAEKKIAAVLQDYNIWADMHQGRDMTFLKIQGKSPPFFTETSTAQIKKEIREKVGPIPENPALGDSELLFNARVFLLMAQQMDYQNSQTATFLETADSIKRNLLKQLKGESETSVPGSEPGDLTSKDNLRDYMIPERLHAFGRVLQYAEKTSGVYVTANRSVMEYLLEKSPHMKIFSTTGAVLPAENTTKVDTDRQERFMRHLEMIVTASAPAAGDQMEGLLQEKTTDTKAGLTLYLIPDQTPRTFFGKCTAIAPIDSVSGSGNNSSPINTLICFVEY